jgi:hypothetical protein
MLSRLAPEFGPTVQELISKAMSVAAAVDHKPCASKEARAADQEKCLLLLLVEREPDAMQLLQQQLFAAEAAKVAPSKEGLSSRNFPGTAFAEIRSSLNPPLQPWNLFGKGTSPSSPSLDEIASHAAAKSSNSVDSTLGASADKPDKPGLQPSSGFCKALDAALFITRQHGESADLAAAVP